MTKNFKQDEFACKCGCGENRISPIVVLVWQIVRDRFGTPVTITSGCRCTEHNKNVGGVSDSQHCLKGDDLTHAADGQTSANLSNVLEFLNYTFPNCLGIGIYDNFIHIDDRMDRAYRWDKRTK